MMTDNHDKKTRIVQAATEIFARLPYHQVKMEDIALQASVGKGTIYEYFNSKDDLFFSMMGHSVSAYREEIISAVQSGRSVQDKLKIMLQHHLRFIEKNADMAYILATDRGIPHQQCQEMLLQHRSELFRLMVSLLEAGISSGEFRQLDSQVAANSILGTFYALWGQAILDAHRHAGQFASAEHVEKILDFFLLGLTNVNR
jgi:AcrR family transcriptional regulator